jgi:hypothetical protein
MKNTTLTTVTPVPSSLVTPPVSNPIDAEVDIEVLRTVPKAFEIADENTANWLVKKVVAARQYGERVKEWAEQERRRAEREEATLLYLFGRQLERWVKGEIERLAGKKKSICLPGGTVGFRRVNASLQVDDEQTVLLWAKRNCPQAVVVKESLSRSELKSHFEATGVIPDEGAHVEPERESFSIR